jgi:DNA-binding response OmpR family regulator
MKYAILDQQFKLRFFRGVDLHPDTNQNQRKASPKTEKLRLAENHFSIGNWLVEPCLNRLTRDGESIQIELKMMDVLVCLAKHSGELVERQTLIDTAWATEYI